MAVQIGALHDTKIGKATVVPIAWRDAEPPTTTTIAAPTGGKEEEEGIHGESAVMSFPHHYD